MIRLPDIPALQGTNVNMPQMRAGAAAAPAQALGEVASAIAGVSAHFQSTAEQIQKLENGRMLSEGRNDLATQYSNLAVELERDQDPVSRIQSTRDFFTAYKSQMESAEHPPIVREALLQHFDDFATHATIQQGADSSRLAIQRAGQAMQNELSANLRLGNREGVRVAADNGVASGAITREKRDQILAEADDLFAYRDYQAAIKSNPLEAEKTFNDPAFSANNPQVAPVLEKLQQEAAQEANRVRADFHNDLVISGKNPTADELREMLDNGLIDKASYARRIANMRENPAHDTAVYDTAYTQICEYDKTLDQSGRVEARLRDWIGGLPLPKEDKRELNGRLNDRLNPVKEATPKAAHEREFATRMAVEFDNGEWGKFKFPTDTDNNPDTAPVMVTSLKDYVAASNLRGLFAEQWRQALKQLPDDADFDTVKTVYEGLKQSFEKRKPLPEVKLSKPALGFDPHAVRQALEPKQTFGGQPVLRAGEAYTGAAATVFGGKNDPGDNGQSALGGTTGEGGREGTAIPQNILQATFPKKDKTWIDANVRTVVKSPDGAYHSLKVADFGTAEWVWKKNGKPVLDLTEGASKEMGGRVVYDKGGKLRDLQGLNGLSFAVVSIDTGKDSPPLATMTWDEAKAAWARNNPPGSPAYFRHSLFALRQAWEEAGAGLHENTR